MTNKSNSKIHTNQMYLHGLLVDANTDCVYFKSKKQSKTFISFSKRKSNWNFICKWCICTVNCYVCECMWFGWNHSFCIRHLQQLVYAEKTLKIVVANQHILWFIIWHWIQRNKWLAQWYLASVQHWLILAPSYNYVCCNANFQLINKLFALNEIVRIESSSSSTYCCWMGKF